MPSLAHAADGESGIIEYSADNSTWGDTSKIVWSTDILIPGGTNTTTFYVRNASDRAGEAHFYVGDYEISDGMEAFLRVDVNGVTGNPLTATGNAATPGTQLNSVRLAPGQSAKVAFVIGMPVEAGNSSQNGSIYAELECGPHTRFHRYTRHARRNRITRFRFPEFGVGELRFTRHRISEDRIYQLRIA